MIWIGLSLAILAGCGAQQQRSYGIDEETKLVIRAEELVGTTMTIEPAFKKSITEADLTPYQFGLGGFKDPEVQNLETVVVKVSVGTHRVRVERNGVALVDRELYFSQGQTRELRIR
jgi:hypothetical protein